MYVSTYARTYVRTPPNQTDVTYCYSSRVREINKIQLWLKRNPALAMGEK